MNEQHSDLLDRARGLAAAQALIDRATAELLTEAGTTCANVSAIAKVLGLHRSTIYRRVDVEKSRKVTRH